MAEGRRTYETGSWQRLTPDKVRLWVSMGSSGLGGKRQRMSKTVIAKSNAAADRALKDFVRECEIKQGRGGMTLWQLAEDYTEIHVSGLAENTQRWYRDTLRRTLAALGHVKLAALTAVMIEKYYKALADPNGKPFEEGYPNGLSETSIAHHHRALSALLRWGYEKDLLDRPIIDKVKAPSGGGASMHAFALDPAQRAAYHRALAEQAERSARAGDADSRELATLSWRLMGQIAISMGLRRGELLGIAWADIDGGVLTVRQQVQRVTRPGEPGRLELTPLKSKSAYRALQIPGELLPGLDRLRQLQRSHFLQLGLGRTDLLFPTLSGELRTPTHATAFFKSVFQAAGIEGATLHTLRHTCGSFMLSAGYSPADVAYYLGHSSASVTLGTYAHKQADELQRMAAAAAGLL